MVASVTSDDVSNEGFPFGTCRTIELGGIPVLASRISYVGELGWELYVPMEQGARLWDTLWEAGQPQRIVPFGIGVYGTTGRLEKGYRAHGAELELEFDLVEADMLRPKVKEADFIGRAAYLEQRSKPPVATLCTLTVDDNTSASGVKRYMLGREPILTADGGPITDAKGRRSFVTSAGSGPSVGRHILLSYLPPEYAVAGTKLQVEYFGERYPVTVAVVGLDAAVRPGQRPGQGLTYRRTARRPPPGRAPGARRARAAHNEHSGRLWRADRACRARIGASEPGSPLPWPGLAPRATARAAGAFELMVSRRCVLRVQALPREQRSGRSPDMRVLVCVKRVPATAGKITLTADEQAIDTRYLGFTVSPHEECGVEEAVRIVEAHGGTSTVLTLGPEEAIDQLREAMAIGIDGAILLETDGSEWSPMDTAAAIVDAVRTHEAADGPFDLIMFGNEAADTGDYQVGVRVAVALDRPIVTGRQGPRDPGRRRRRAARGGRWRLGGLRGPATGGVSVQGGTQPAALPVRAGTPAGPEEGGRADRAHSRPRATTARIRLRVPVEQESAVEILGEGPAAAPRVVEVFRRLGLIA